MKLLARCPITYLPERAYSLEVVLSRFMGLEHRMEESAGEQVELLLDGQPERGRLVMPDVLFQTPASDWLTPRALPRLPLSQHDVTRELPAARLTGPLPVLFGSPEPGGPLIRELDGDIRLELDVFGSAFFMLTRYEELVADACDPHERFPFAASLAHRAGFVQRPIVDEHVAVLRAAMARLWSDVPRPARLPSVLITHDIDVPFSVRHRTVGQKVRMIGGDVVKRGDPSLAIRRLRASVAEPRAGHRDPAFTFDFIMDVAERHDLRSSFYFMTQPHGRKPANYSLHEPWARSVLRSIAERGHHIGLHVSYDAYLRPDATRREFETLLAAARASGVCQDEWGGRQHWLRWRNPVTWRNWDAAGLDYDATVGFEEVAGFRCGTARPFPVFDLEARRPLRLVERPLHFMDSTFFDRGVSAADAAATALSLYEACKRHDGQFVMLWHNDALASKYRRAEYADLLRNMA